MTFFSNITKFCGVEFIFSPKPSPILSFKKNPKKGTFLLTHSDTTEISYEFTEFTGTVTMRKQKNIGIVEKEVIDLNTPAPSTFKVYKSPVYNRSGFASAASRTPTPGDRSKPLVVNSNKTNITQGSGMSIDSPFSIATENSAALLSPDGLGEHKSPLFKHSDEIYCKKGFGEYDSEEEDLLDEAFQDTQVEELPPDFDDGAGRAETLTIDLLKKLEMKK
jgi:hypothetical protein